MKQIALQVPEYPKNSMSGSRTKFVIFITKGVNKELLAKKLLREKIWNEILLLSKK